MFTKVILNFFIASCLIFVGVSAQAAPEKSLDQHWIAFNPKSTNVISYSEWKTFLANYIVEHDGDTFVEYGKVTAEGKDKLSDEITRLSNINISTYNRDQQLAYWINLYNMATVYLILENYPVKSITDINSGLFSSGPWDEKILTVDGEAMSLNTIEHNIIRAIWNDPRIHAAVNCASASCPNLQAKPFEGDKIYSQLDQAFKHFMNSDKGLRISGDHVQLTKITDWYGSDFGGEAQLRRFIGAYIDDPKTQELLQSSPLEYQAYDWSLNEYLTS